MCDVLQHHKLHDGNQLENQPRVNSKETYPIRHKNLFADINQFVKKLEKRGRNVMLMIVPEHGANLKGDKVQFAGLREIPSPAIVSVPVAIKFIGPDVQNYSQIVVDDSTSYFALSELVSKALQTDVFGGIIVLLICLKTYLQHLRLLKTKAQ